MKVGSRGVRARVGARTALALLCLASALPARAQTVTEERTIPVQTAVPVACLGERVSVNADIHIRHQVTFMPDGSVHVVAEGNVERATGVAIPSGRTYVGSGSGSREFTIGAPTIPVYFFLFAQGTLVGSDGSVLRVRVIMLETLFPDGNIDGVPFWMAVDCS